MLDQVRGAKLSERTKESLPAPGVLHCNVRNTNWLLCYWRDLQYPDPLQPLYGFVARGRQGIMHDDLDVQAP